KAKTESERTAIKETLEALESGASVGQDDTDPAFPGYLLLIDEPENALHPMAARAAQRHLYKLAEDPEWQVMLTTHSPYFINPLADHTTIVRLSHEPGQDGKITRKTYRSDTIEFDVNTKRQLQAIQQMDAGFSEIFFGSYPIVTEGDTEFAAFVAAIVSQNHPLTNTASIIRARGKAILPAIIRMLRHFNVGFSIIHDVDWPFDKNGDKNGMWTINESIAAEISECRAQGMVVNHRCSLPDFERFLGGKALGKDKPVSAFMRIASDEALGERVQNLFVDLCDGQDRNPFGFEPGGTTVLNELIVGELERWNNENGGKEALRLYGKSA
ncbi:MAG: AAA family ATPase, partial [Rhizobiales bacterium]|nr:AAA family ATPase [Hyphomicrobiales bacterium]